MEQRRIDELLKEARDNNKKTYSFTFCCVKSKEEKNQIEEIIEKLKIFNPLFVSVTSKIGESITGSTLRTVFKIRKLTDWNIMPHITCIDKSKKEINLLLRMYEKLGVRNVLALRGDLPEQLLHSLEDHRLKDWFKHLFKKDKNFEHTSDLIKFINKNFPDFSIGAVCYPNKHKDADDMKFDRMHAREKIRFGADFLITEMFFRNTTFLWFERFLIGSSDIKIPILPGVLTITDWKKTKDRSGDGAYSINVPKELDSSMSEANGSQFKEIEIGVRNSIRQCRNLLDNGVKHIHFFVMNRHDVIMRILNEVF